MTSFRFSTVSSNYLRSSRLLLSCTPRRSFNQSVRLFEQLSTPGATRVTRTTRPTAQTTGRPDRLSIWPFVFILAAGSAFFAYTVKTREGLTHRPQGTLPIQAGSPPPRKQDK